MIHKAGLRADGVGEDQMIKNALHRLKTIMLKSKESKKKRTRKEYSDIAEF